MSNANWWANKLGSQVPQSRPTDIPMPPSQQPMTPYVPPQAHPAVSKAQSASQVQSCPDCGSGNYFAINNSTPRCYDCGYPLQQSGSKYGALTGAKVEGPTKSSRGNDATNNFNPQQIVGRIDG